jgi:integrase/recombinase XerD
MLREYYTSYNPKIWLFGGQNAEDQYSEQILQSVLKHPLRKVGIKNPASLHWLKHSYATHLLHSKRCS